MSKQTSTVRCLRTVQSGNGLHAPGEVIELSAADAAALTALGAVESTDVPVEVPGLIGYAEIPATLAGLTAGEVVARAFGRSNLTAEGWNALPEAERKAHIESLAVDLELELLASQGGSSADADGGDEAQGTAADAPKRQRGKKP